MQAVSSHQQGLCSFPEQTLRDGLLSSQRERAGFSAQSQIIFRPGGPEKAGGRVVGTMSPFILCSEIPGPEHQLGSGASAGGAVGRWPRAPLILLMTHT